jgi:hypothetical protein
MNSYEVQKSIWHLEKSLIILFFGIQATEKRICLEVSWHLLFWHLANLNCCINFRMTVLPFSAYICPLIINMSLWSCRPRVDLAHWGLSSYISSPSFFLIILVQLTAPSFLVVFSSFFRRISVYKFFLSGNFSLCFGICTKMIEIQRFYIFISISYSNSLF